jgi:WD40 repeat protein
MRCGLPDGQFIISGSHGVTLNMWEADTGTAVGNSLTGHSEWVTFVAFYPNGSHIAAGSSDETARL